MLADLAEDDPLSALAEPSYGRLDLFRGSSDGAGRSALLVGPDDFVAWASADGESNSATLQSALTR